MLSLVGKAKTEIWRLINFAVNDDGAAFQTVCVDTVARPRHAGGSFHQEITQQGKQCLVTTCCLLPNN